MKTLSLFIMYVLWSAFADAQTKDLCGSNLNLTSISKNDPAFYKRIMAFEQHTKNFIKASRTTGTPENSRLISSDKTIIIPVVVHIIWKTQAQNISDARVNSQIQVLNEDFRRLNADAVNTPAAFQSVASDMNIEFRLACIDPNGNATTGITKTTTTVDIFSLDAAKRTNQGGKDGWPADTYLNIWVCNFGLPGEATFPSQYYCSADSWKDGIVMNYAYFGVTNSGNNGLGRVGTHEVGHWLNLFHVFGAEGDPNSCASDFVDDTPPALVENYTCYTFPHTTSCSPSSPGEMYMNYMDYTPDNCRNLFTQGQKLRARASFAESLVPGVCTRFGALQNYFSIKPIPAGCGSTTITLQNPMCLPVTWTITGNATITPLAQTNKYQLTGTGTVTISAKGADSYVDDKQFTFSDPPINLTIASSAIDCNHTTFTATPQTGTTYNWSVNGDLLIDGTLTSKSTSSNSIDVTGIDGIVYVNSTAACGTLFQTSETFSPYTREIVLDPNSPLMWIDHINALIEPIPFASYYRWYVNDVLVGQGESKINYCTCHFESWDERQCGQNTIRVEVDIVGCGTMTAGELEFEVACGFARLSKPITKRPDIRQKGFIGKPQKMAEQVSIYPNPVHSLVTVRLPNNSKLKQVQLIDLTGAVLSQHSTTAGYLTLDLSNYARGIYIIRVKTDFEVFSKKIEHIR